jgi:LacI family transcriptional regulator
MSSSTTPVATLQDVAHAADVSVSTASRALNGLGLKYRISQKTILIVKKHADRLGFQPSQMARSLQARRSGLIGVVVPDVSNPFFAAIAKEVALQADEQGFSVLLADSCETTEAEVKLVAQLQSRQVEGLVVCPVGTEAKHLIQTDAAGIPLVVVDRCFLGTTLTSVMSDNSRGAELAVKQLLRRGHRIIGCLQGLPGTLPNETRLQAVRKSLCEAGITLDESLVVGDNFTEQSGYLSAKSMLASRPDVTSIFAFSTPNAFGALRAASELGRAVPDDLSLITFDHSPVVDLLKTPLSTISQDVVRLGRTAAELMMKHLHTGKKPRKSTHVVPIQLVSRQSVSRISPR